MQRELPINSRVAVQIYDFLGIFDVCDVDKTGYSESLQRKNLP